MTANDLSLSRPLEARSIALDLCAPKIRSLSRNNNGVLYTGQTFFQRIASRLHAPVLTTDPFKPYLARNDTAPLQIFQLSNEANIQWGENTFTSISAGGYGSWRNNDFSDNQNLQYGFGTGGMDTFGSQFSQEFRLTSPKDRQFEWTIGLYSFYESLEDEMHDATAGTDTAPLIPLSQVHLDVVLPAG